MTLPECIENTPEDSVEQQTYAEKADDVSDIKEEKGTIQDRLVTGAYNCANFLHSNPEDIVLCLLTDTGATEDVTLHIEHTLIEAYCYENDIPVVKGQAAVYMLEKEYLSEINQKDESETDLSCVLVLFSKKVEKEQSDELEKPYFSDEVFHDVSDGPSIKYPMIPQ